MSSSRLLNLMATIATEKARVAAIPRRGIATGIPAANAGAADANTGLGSPGVFWGTALSPPAWQSDAITVIGVLGFTILFDFPADTAGRATTLGAPHPNDVIVPSPM